MTAYYNTMKSPIVILEKLPINLEKSSYIKEELIISDISDHSENESKPISNNNLTLKNVKHKLINQTQDYKTAKNCSTRDSYKLGSNEFLSNSNGYLNNLKSPIVVLERLSIKLKQRLLLKDEARYSYTSEYSDYKESNADYYKPNDKYSTNKVKVENENKMPELLSIKKSSEFFEYQDNSQQHHITDIALLFDISNSSDENVVNKTRTNAMTIANESLLEFISENKTKDAIEFNKTLFDSISHRTLYNFKGLKMKLFKEKCITCNKIQQRIGDKISTRCNTCEAAVYYECLICRSQYKYPAGIYTHISLKHTNSDTSKPVKCERCGIEFKAQRNMKEHLRYCKVLPYMKCEFCSMMAKRKNCLRKHILIKHKNDIQAMDIENLLQKIVENSQELRRQAIRRAEIVYGGCTSSRVEPFPIAKHIKLFCKKCNTTFKKLLGMDQRSCRICGAQLFMQCVKCDSIYKFRSSISMHLKSKCVLNDNLVLHCNDCNYITFTKQRLKRHIYRKHMLIKLENYLKCRICSKGFKFKEDLLNHQLNCENLKERICNICRFKTNRRTNLSLHMKNKHTPTTLLQEKMHVDVNVKIVADSITTYCSKCNSYNKPIEKITKCLYCKTPVIYCCKKCNLQKQKYVRMRIHVIRKHGEKIYACTKGCGISFSYLYDCRQHLRFCGKKPHLHCDQCSFKTKYKHTLLAHKRRNCAGIAYTDVPEKKVLCYCYYCDKPFESKIQKLRHVKLCSRTTSFLFCDHCSFRTVFKPVLINHIQSKHGARLFRGINAFHCKNCTKVFRNYFVYSKHIENCRFREKKT